MKKRNIIIFSVLLVSVIVAILSLSDNIMSPYVSFKDAVKSGSYVQVIGKLDKNVPVSHENGSFSFVLTGEEGESMKVVHTGQVPQNFDHADNIVLIGKYDAGAGQFVADKVLVKCPSKYTKQR